MRILLFAIVCLTLAGCFGLPSEETRLKRYPTILAEWQKEGSLVDHFPEAIPASAAAAKLSAFPGAFQGGAWFQLHLKLPPAEVARIFEGASKRAKAFYDGGDMLKLVNESKEDGLPGTSFYTSGTEERDFPDDYRIFIYDARPYQPGEVHQWNHGKTRGVVVSRTRNEVIYFAESW